jgi:crotonobetainyl-CoA:carnitine CoA-transferase CaiB-like acyl-CoA transferase
VEHRENEKVRLPLAGIRVLELSLAVMGPTAGMLLRNKKSLVLKLKSPEGKTIMERLVETADVLIENYATGTIDRLGFGYDHLSGINPRLIFCVLKGFIPGPYEKRPALDEVCQMMGGLRILAL